MTKFKFMLTKVRQANDQGNKGMLEDRSNNSLERQ
jgi:hypothetical protein